MIFHSHSTSLQYVLRKKRIRFRLLETTLQEILAIQEKLGHLLRAGDVY